MFGEMHLWDEKGHQVIPYENIAYQECKEEEHTNIGLNGEHLKHTNNWYFSKKPKL